MHVLIIPSWYPRHPKDIGGSFFREQALALHKHGCKVGVIYPELRSLRNWRSTFSDLNGINVEKDEGVDTYRSYGMNWFPRTVLLASKLFVWHGFRLYDRYVTENGVPDIVHVHSLLYAGSLAAEINRKYEIPFLVTEHSTAFARDLISEKGMHFARDISLSASRKFAVSSEFAKLLNERVGSKNIPWEEMPNIVNERFYSYELPTKKIGSNFQFFNVALMDRKKRQDNILYAFAKICKNYPSARLTLGGDGPERIKLEKLARDLNIADKVKFPGLLSREEVLAKMATSDVFVLASRYETFGVVVVEALALGKPVIATRCGGPESIIRKEDGILISVDDVNALAVAMCQMIENRNNYDSSEIRQTCVARYSENVIASRLKDVYIEVISKAKEVPKKSPVAAATNVDV